MSVFVDTSALYAVLDRDDANHVPAKATWRELLGGEEVLISHNYVLVETCALVQHRLGIAALRALQEDVFPVLQVEWIDESRHQTALEAALTAARRKLSLVDCASFLVMRQLGIEKAFCFDKHFHQQGFGVVPKPA